MNWLKKIFHLRRVRKLFPKEVNDVWLAWNGYKEKESWGNILPYWDENDRYIDYRVGDVVPLLVKEGCVGHYEIDYYTVRGSDRLSSDDGRHYDFKFRFFTQNHPQTPSSPSGTSGSGE